jgi:hypothetical protein
MRYIIFFICILGGFALKFHFENEELESYKQKKKSLPTLNGIGQSPSLSTEKDNAFSQNASQASSDLVPLENSFEEEIPDQQESADLAEEHQKGLDDIESEEDYKNKIQQKIDESGSDFISLNKKKVRVTK